METLPIHVFKGSFGPVAKLLNEHDVQYQMHETRSGAVMAASGIIEIIISPAMWSALAAVVIIYVKSKHGRKVIITTKDNKVIQAEGLTKKELEPILKEAKNLIATDASQSRE